MKIGRVVRHIGTSTEGLARQYDGGKLTHYRTRTTNLNPAIKRVEEIAKSAIIGKSEYQYLGSVDRSVIDDWLRKQQKSWHEFATDKELKAKFMLYYKNDFSKLMASTYQERSLAVNRAISGRDGNSVSRQYRPKIRGSV